MVLVRLMIFDVFTAVIQTTWGAAITSGNLGIVGGYKVAIKDVPYMAAVFLGDSFFCGGSIVHEKFILTAAHCIPDKEPNYFKILIGSDRLNYGGITVNVDALWKHPEFNHKTFHNDIALLKVRQSLTNNDLRTTQVRLPADRLVIQEGFMVNVTGWGWMKGDSGGPLTHEGVQIGIVSKGKLCGTYPGVYTRVANYLDWIESTIEDNM